MCWGRTEQFTRFLLEQTEYKVLSQDQWVGFLRFTQEVWPARAASRCLPLGALPGVASHRLGVCVLQACAPCRA